MTIHRTAATFFISIFFTGTACAGSIPPLPEVDAATAAAHPELAEKRTALGAERDTLREISGKQGAACGEVEEGTPKERDCAAWLERITQDVGLHIKATHDLATAISAAAGYKAFSFPAIDVKGEVTLLTADGRELTGKEAAGVAIDNRTKIVTGPDSRARMILPDGTSFTVGPNSEMVLDDFVYDPSTSVQKLGIKLTKGTFRWVTGKVKRVDPKIELRGTIGGIRGTDFECFIAEDESGFVKLYSGEMEFTDKKTGIVTVLTAGNMMTFRGETTDAPQPIPAGV